ncbi:conserved hypothetical protein [Methylorubrum populi BJ001]|jgi:hypothetical protein|uniref:Uncharacterized protein n=1 Tax=Methylorubrum populi (strain ATCC BAA-705 / NCIMB 13946 / BJ001) TaxID=441620 RepID=B1ZLE9_METPB|nr:hypothetical protein [Methylorubrum populi]ACB80230.1 conserved hypothetical protein [Methylorubrum populi BJ001]OAH17219.1 hypothetical protein AX289_08960 [Methylorubrum populi]PZP66785.1 MAG: hypothetical protein DI590_23030 [Methylorubrum populi]
MPHFSKEFLETAPETLENLREILHGRQTGGRTGRSAETAPTKEERFGLSGGRRVAARKRRHTTSADA